MGLGSRQAQRLLLISAVWKRLLGCQELAALGQWSSPEAGRIPCSASNLTLVFAGLCGGVCEVGTFQARACSAQLMVTAGWALHASKGLCSQLSVLPQAVEATGFIGKSLNFLGFVVGCSSVFLFFCCALFESCKVTLDSVWWLGLCGSVLLCA